MDASVSVSPCSRRPWFRPPITLSIDANFSASAAFVNPVSSAAALITTSATARAEVHRELVLDCMMMLLVVVQMKGFLLCWLPPFSPVALLLTDCCVALVRVFFL